MKVDLLHYTPLWVCSKAIRKCWASECKSDNGGDVDKALILRVGNKNKHSSTLEHLVYSFDISGISRACLQELARHRHASLSVKSTRYTLKELKDEEVFTTDDKGMDRASKYVVLPRNLIVSKCIVAALDNLRALLITNLSNDIVKYVLPEAYKTSLVWTINARALQNFLSLRTSKAALWEIRDLAYELYNKLPEDHTYLFEESITDER
jgi:thymidylate synthase (FAD)